MTIPVWVLKIWFWLRKNWMWMLLPVGIFLWVLGRMAGKRQVTITSTAMEGHREVADKVDAEKKERLEAAEDKVAAQLAGSAAEHAADVVSVRQEQLEKAKQVEGDSDKVNSHLLEVGKSIRR